MKKLFLILSIICSLSVSTYAQNNSEANSYYGKGLSAYLSGDYKNAVFYFTKGYEMGDKSECAQYLGELYYEGLGCTRDTQKSFKYFKESADNGNAFSQYSLGLAYYMGEGCPQDYSLARIYFKKAADAGFIEEAAYNYAGLLYNGQGGSQNLDEALKYYIKAADMKYPQAQLIIGLTYYFGEYKGLKLNQNKEKSYQLLKEAASRGLSSAAMAIEDLF